MGKSYLIQQLSMAGERLFVNAYGGTMHIASNKTALGRLANRRVDLMILGEGDKVPEVSVALATPPTPTPTPKPTPTPTPTPTLGPSADAQSAYRVGVEAYFNDQYDKAIANFERCLKLDPSNSKARDYLAKAQAKLAKMKRR
jgi:TolA-binding protein